MTTERDTNARLIAAAPELFAALQVAELALRERGLTMIGEYKQIEAALAKAACVSSDNSLTGGTAITKEEKRELFRNGHIMQMAALGWPVEFSHLENKFRLAPRMKEIVRWGVLVAPEFPSPRIVAIRDTELDANEACASWRTGRVVKIIEEIEEQPPEPDYPEELR